MTIEPACNLAYTELRYMGLIDRKALVEHKPYTGHGRLFLAGGLVALLTLRDTHCVLPSRSTGALEVQSTGEHLERTLCSGIDLHQSRQYHGD
ncbi:MAG: hypothetical protein ABI612_04385 [Betaproteobacteria bacterium]